MCLTLLLGAVKAFMEFYTIVYVLTFMKCIKYGISTYFVIYNIKGCRNIVWFGQFIILYDGDLSLFGFFMDQHKQSTAILDQGGNYKLSSLTRPPMLIEYLFLQIIWKRLTFHEWMNNLTCLNISIIIICKHVV